jgi:hypothetical protein
VEKRTPAQGAFLHNGFGSLSSELGRRALPEDRARRKKRCA